MTEREHAIAVTSLAVLTLGIVAVLLWANSGTVKPDAVGNPDDARMLPQVASDNLAFPGRGKVTKFGTTTFAWSPLPDGLNFLPEVALQPYQTVAKIET